MNDCIFCQIVEGKQPCHKIWEDDKYLAFLSIYPNTEGFSVVIPKAHYPSYVFDLPEKVYLELLDASKRVGKIIDATFKNVGRTGLILEGFGVNHAHAKLFPMHGTASEQWEPIKSNINKYFEFYEGYISSHDSERADDEKLTEIAKRIREESNID